MGVGVEPVGEELRDRLAAILARRQADAVQNDQLDRRLRRPLVAVGRFDALDVTRPALRVDAKAVPRSVCRSAPVAIQLFGSSSSLRPKRAMR
jgi:hypothetical protein